MRTELIHSYSSSGLSRSSSSNSIQKPNGEQQDIRKFSTISGILPEQFSNFEDQNSNTYSCGNSNDGPVKKCFGQICRRKVLERKFPIVKWLPVYNLEKLLLDVIAGITVGLTILPQGLAYASVADLPSQIGLYSCFVGSIVYILLGSTVDIKIGPTAILAIMTKSYSYGHTQNAILITFISGFVTSLMGLFQLGFLVNFISIPVINGFTNAAAVTICLTQVKSLFGLKFHSENENLLGVIQGLWEHIDNISLWDSLLSLFCFLFLFALKILPGICSKFVTEGTLTSKSINLVSSARSAVVVIVCTLVFISIGKENTPVVLVGEIQRGLPSFQIPPFYFVDDDQEFSIWGLIEDNLTILILLPLLGLMEHVTSAKAFMKSKRLDVNQEMLANGFSNLIGSFFGSMVTTGSLSLTTVNHASGSQSPLGGLVTVTLVIVSLEYLTTFFYFISKACLASVIIFSVLLMIDLRIFIFMWRSKKMDIIPWVLTFGVSLFTRLEYGLLFGFSISVVFLLYYAGSARVKVKKGTTTFGSDFILISLDRSLVFPSVEYIRYIIGKSGGVWANGKLPVVIDGHHIQVVDYSASLGILDLFKSYNERSQPLILWRLKPSVLRVLTGVMQSQNISFRSCSTIEELESLLQEIQDQEKYSKENTETSNSFTFNVDRCEPSITLNQF